MKRRLLSFVLAFAMLLSVTPVAVFAAPGTEPNLEGAGTETNPYLIENLDDLEKFRDYVDTYRSDGLNQCSGMYFKLTADINLAGINWNPIGSMSGDHGSFKGVFDGNGHIISNLNVQQAGEGLGLFARTAGNAEIKNLTLNNVTVKSTDNSNYVSGVIGNAYASTKVTNVHVTGNIDISGRGYIGGIAGHGYVVMDNVSVKGEGTISSTFWCAGGILGYGGEGATNIMNATVEGTGAGLTITSAAGGLGAIVGMAEDNNGTQPISGSNLSAKNVDIKTYTGAYGDAYANYALGYLYGGNPTSKLTGNLSVEDVSVTTSTGEPANIVDAVAINRLNYVSLGDSMSNGYGLPGYNANNGVEDYGEGSYANQFANEFGFNHAQLAMSAMRAEDLHWLLEVNYNDPAVINVINTLASDYRYYRDNIEAFEALWNSVFTNGDFWTWKELVNDYRFDIAAAYIENLNYPCIREGKNMTGAEKEAIYAYYDDVEALKVVAEYYQTSVKNADVISLGIGNGNFGVFAFGRIMEAIGFSGSPADAMKYNIDNALREVGPELRPLVDTLLADAKNVLAQYGIVADDGSAEVTPMEALYNTFMYATISYALNYAGTVEAILQLNPDADIIQVALMNTFVEEQAASAGIFNVGSYTDLTLGDVMDLLFKPLNAYLAALPTAMQAVNNSVYANADFYWAEADYIKCIVDTYKYPITNEIVRDRFVESIVGEPTSIYPKGDGMVWQLLKDMDMVVYITFGDIVNYERLDDAAKLAYAATNQKEAMSISMYLAFEKAIVAGKNTSVGIGSIMNLGSLLGGNPFGAIMEDFEEASKIQDDVHLDAICEFMAAQSGDKLTATQVKTILLGSDAEVNAVYYALVEATASLPAGSVANVIADNDAGKNVLYAIVAKQMECTPDEIANLVAANNAGAVAGVAAAKQNIVDGVATAEATVASFNISAIAGPLYQLLVMPEVLGETVANSNLSGLLALFARCVIGNGIGSHPAEDGHNSMFAAMKNAYENEFTSQDQTINNLDYYYMQAYAKAKESGAIDAALAAMVAAKGALKTAYTTVNLYPVDAEFADIKTALLNEIAAAEATAAEISDILAADQLGNLRAAYAALMELEDDLWAHVSNMKALSAEIGVVADIYLTLAIEAANHYSAMIDTMVNNAYAWVINGVVEFNAEYAALVDKTGALADQVDPALGAAVRKFMIETPADTLAILYAYGEEAVLNLFIAAVDAADDVYVAATALAAVLKDHGVDIYRAIMNDLTCQQLRQQLIALNDQLLALEAQAKNAPMSTSLALYAQIDAIKAQAMQLAVDFYNAAIAAVAAADPIAAQMLDDAFQAFLKAVGTVGEAADGYAAWLPGHANAMAGDLLAALVANWDEFAGVAGPIVDEIIWQILYNANDYVEGVIDEVENQIRQQLAILEAELLALKSELETAVGEAKAQIQSQIDAIYAKITELKAALAAGITDNVLRIYQLLEEIKNDVITLANAAMNAALTEAHRALSEIAANLAQLDEIIKNTIGNKYTEFKAQIGILATHLLDKLVETAIRVAPEIDTQLYDFFYNNPDKVIAFMEEYSDVIFDIIAEYGDEALGTIGVALFLYGEDLAEYLIENREAVLAGIMTWADKYGERTAAMIQIYAEALGMCDIVRAEIAKLEEKIDALEAQLTYQIKVLNEKLNVELDKLNEQLSDLYAQLETAIGEQKAILEAKIAEIKALIAQVEMQIEQVKALIAEIQDNLANAQQQLAELSAKMQNLVSALLQLDDALKYLLDAGIEAATPVIQQALDGVANAVRDLVGVISTETAEQLDKMIHEAKDFLNRAFYDATHANYHIDAESSYVSLGDNKEVARLFAEYLKDYVAKEGVNFKYSTTDLSVENAKISDLAAILSENVSAIASADLISLNYSYDAIAEETLNILLDLLLEGNTAAMTDHNWAALAGESAATEIEAFLADLHATMVAQGFGVTLSEMIGFPVESNITIADAAILAVEHFAYSAVEYAVLMPQTVLSIQQINPDALIMVNAMSNPLAGAYITLLGEEFHFGDYIDYIVDATNVECTIFAAVTENVVFVPATKINTNCTGAAIIQVNSLNDVIDLMYAYKAGSLIQINPTAEGNAYAASKMAESLTITVEAADGLLGDANNDGVVNSIDAAMVLQYDIGMIQANAINLAVSDVNGDGAVNSIDAAMILQYDIGMIQQFPAAIH